MLPEVVRKKGRLADDNIHHQSLSTNMACTSRSKEHEKDSKLSAKCPNEDTVLLNFSGSLAKRWITEKGSADDISFIECLLDVYSKYKQGQIYRNIHHKMLVDDPKCSVSHTLENETSTTVPKASGVIVEQSQANTAEKARRDSLVQVEIDRSDITVCNEKQCKISNRKHFNDNKAEQNSDSDLVEILINKIEDTICEICQEKVIGETKRYHVFSEHFSLYLKCEICESGEVAREADINLIDIDDYFSHKITVHGDHSKECLFCKHVVQANTFSRHLIHMHWKQLFCSCDTCGVGSDINTSPCILKGISVGGHLLKKHFTPNLEKVSCEICGSFVQQLNMARHMKSVHEGAREICELCGKSFNDVNRHKKRVHVESPCKYQCTICNKKLTSKWNLTVHSRLHTGEKPFTCEICGKSFHQKVELKLHVRNHHENPHNKKSNKNLKIAETSKPIRTVNKSIVSKKSDNIQGPVSLLHEQDIHAMFSSSKSPGSSNVYTVIPSQSCSNALLSSTSNTDSSNVQNVTVFDVPNKDLCSTQLVWIAQAHSGEDVSMEGSS